MIAGVFISELILSLISLIIHKGCGKVSRRSFCDPLVTPHKSNSSFKSVHKFSTTPYEQSMDPFDEKDELENAPHGGLFDNVEVKSKNGPV